jgi:hypothetical protein
MKNTNLFLVLMMGLGLILWGCPTVEDDDDSAGDDDDMTGDDDDDDTPEYTGTIDLPNALLETGCTVDVPSSSEDEDPSGMFDFYIEMDGWAEDCWVEMWDLTEDPGYCEGFDPDTGEPCNYGGVERPGWFMGQDVDGFGWDEMNGFWDSWWLDLDYTMTWPPMDDESLFVCENMGHNFEIWYCCCDFYDGDFCDCTMHPMDDL